MVVIDKVDRKPMLLVGSVVMFVSTVIAGIVVAKFRHDWPLHEAIRITWKERGGQSVTYISSRFRLLPRLCPEDLQSIGTRDYLVYRKLEGYLMGFSHQVMVARGEKIKKRN
jgi:hypothetical protein